MTIAAQTFLRTNATKFSSNIAATFSRNIQHISYDIFDI